MHMELESIFEQYSLELHPAEFETYPSELSIGSSLKLEFFSSMHSLIQSIFVVGGWLDHHEIDGSRA